MSVSIKAAMMPVAAAMILVVILLAAILVEAEADINNKQNK